MKILQINNHYARGSTGKIVQCIHTELKRKGIESIVCYGRGAKSEDPNAHKVCGELYSKVNNLLSRFTGLMYGGLFFSTAKLISIIKKEKPDVVHLHCLNGYFVNIYKLVAWLNKHNVKTVLSLHAEFMHTGNCSHAFDCDKWLTGCGHCPRCKAETKSLIFDRTATSWKKMKKAFDGFDNLTVVSASPWLMDRAKRSPILADKPHCVVFNGLNTEVFKPYDTDDLKEKHGLNGKRVLFFATTILTNDVNHIKGGHYIIQLAKALEKDDIKVLVAGRYEDNLVLPKNMTLLGNLSDQKLLAAYYAMADLSLLASKKETFSMVCAESLSCGTPVVGFEAGAPEQIALKDYSRFVKYGDVVALEEAVRAQLTKTWDRAEIARKAEETYSDKKMTESYIRIYNDEK